MTIEFIYIFFDVVSCSYFKVLYVTSIAQMRYEVKHACLVHSLYVRLRPTSENDLGVLDEVVAVSALNDGINP